MATTRSERDASYVKATRLPWAFRAQALPQAFQDSMNHLQAEEIKAVLSLRLLSFIALDPLVLTRGELYAKQYGDRVGFTLHLHRCVNPVGGTFGLPMDNPLCAQLIEAIEANLAGRMFKAAKMSRRLELRARTARARHQMYAGVDEEVAIGASVRDQLEARLCRRISAIEAVAAPGFDRGYSNWLAGFVSASLSPM